MTNSRTEKTKRESHTIDVPGRIGDFTSPYSSRVEGYSMITIPIRERGRTQDSPTWNPCAFIAEKGRSSRLRGRKSVSGCNWLAPNAPIMGVVYTRMRLVRTRE